MTLWGLPSLPGKVMSAVAYLAGGAALAAWATEIGELRLLPGPCQRRRLT